MNLKEYYIVTTIMALIVSQLIISFFGFYLLYWFDIILPFTASILILIGTWYLYIKLTIKLNNLPEKLSQILLPFFISFGYYILLLIVLSEISAHDPYNEMFFDLFFLFSVLNMIFIYVMYIFNGFPEGWTYYAIVMLLTFVMLIVMLATTLVTINLSGKKMILDRRVFIGIAIIFCLFGIAVYQRLQNF